MERHGFDDESFFAHENVSSATECTGLIPALPDDEDMGDEGLEDESKLYAIHAPARKRDRKDGAGCEGRERERR